MEILKRMITKAFGKTGCHELIRECSFRSANQNDGGVHLGTLGNQRY